MELFKLKLTSFEEQLLFYKEIVFPEKETAETNEEQKTKDKPQNKGKISFEYEFDFSFETRIYALKAIDDLL